MYVKKAAAHACMHTRTCMNVCFYATYYESSNSLSEDRCAAFEISVVELRETDSAYVLYSHAPAFRSSARLGGASRG